MNNTYIRVKGKNTQQLALIKILGQDFYVTKAYNYRSKNFKRYGFSFWFYSQKSQEIVHARTINRHDVIIRGGDITTNNDNPTVEQAIKYYTDIITKNYKDEQSLKTALSVLDNTEYKP